MGNENKPSPMKRWPVLVVGGMVLLAFLYSLFGDVGIISTLDLRAKQKGLIAENSRLRAENEQLRGEVEKLRSNPSYIEEIARKELGLMGKKEIVIPLDRNNGSQLPLPPPAAKRVTRKYFLPALGFLHLLLFHFLRFGLLGDAARGWMASAFVMAAFLLVRDLATSRRENRVPDVISQVAWGAAALLELNALSPGISSSRLVPAVIFPAFSFLLPAPPSGVYALASLAFLVWSPYDGFAGGETFFSIAVMAALGTVAGRYVRTRLGSGAEGIVPGKPIGPGGSLVVLPEKPDENAGTVNFEAPKGEDLLAMREMELEEGIQRVLEGIFPIAGAERILYVSPSHHQGVPACGAACYAVGERGSGDLSGNTGIPTSPCGKR